MYQYSNSRIFTSPVAHYWKLLLCTSRLHVVNYSQKQILPMHRKETRDPVARKLQVPSVYNSVNVFPNDLAGGSEKWSNSRVDEFLELLHVRTRESATWNAISPATKWGIRFIERSSSSVPRCTPNIRIVAIVAVLAATNIELGCAGWTGRR